MNPSNPTCVREARPAESGVASLVTIARFHGIPLQRRHLSWLTHADDLSLDLFGVLVAARRCGFDAIPLEGEIDELPEVPRPLIACCTREDGSAAFTVVYDINEDEVLIGDTAVGRVEPMSLAAFGERWTGDVIQMVPDQKALESTREWMNLADQPLRRLQRALGWQPPLAAKIGFSGFALALLTGFVLVARERGIDLAVAQSACIVFSALASGWLAFFSGACPSCLRAAVQFGTMPLAQLGLAFYSAVLALDLSTRSPLTVTGLLMTAAGAHLYLIFLLARGKVRCLGCVCVGLSVFTATGLAFLQTYPASLLLLPMAGAGLAMTWLTQHWASRLHATESRQSAIQLAASLQKEGPTEPRSARVTAYTRAGCPRCLFFDAVWRPAMLAEFGDRVQVEKRPLGRAKATPPVIVVQGSVTAVLTELPTDRGYDLLSAAVQAALDPAYSGLGRIGGVVVLCPTHEESPA